ncbi:MAG TPA: hypothetical protein VNN73_20785 [Blastocatellia bacterium]|nr:hypothetical protein [Blastocatellia bacterium]
MARGWESKAVEAQIESAEAHSAERDKERLDPAQQELLRKKESLLLSRARVLRELEASRNPRYKAILTAALDDLDKKLAQL